MIRHESVHGKDAQMKLPRNWESQLSSYRTAITIFSLGWQTINQLAISY